MGFIQLTEFTTVRPGEVETVFGEWRAQTRGTQNSRSEAPSRRTETDRTPPCRSWSFPRTKMQWPTRTSLRRHRVAARLGRLCEGPVLFRHLDVRRTEAM